MGIMGDINQIGIVTPDIEKSIEEFKKIGLENWSDIFVNVPSLAEGYEMWTAALMPTPAPHRSRPCESFAESGYLIVFSMSLIVMRPTRL